MTIVKLNSLPSRQHCSMSEIELDWNALKLHNLNFPVLPGYLATWQPFYVSVVSEWPATSGWGCTLPIKNYLKSESFLFVFL
jgi:hypothetical protein